MDIAEAARQIKAADNCRIRRCIIVRAYGYNRGFKVHIMDICFGSCTEECRLAAESFTVVAPDCDGAVKGSKGRCTAVHFNFQTADRMTGTVEAAAEGIGPVRCIDSLIIGEVDADRLPVFTGEVDVLCQDIVAVKIIRHSLELFDRTDLRQRSPAGVEIQGRAVERFQFGKARPCTAVKAACTGRHFIGRNTVNEVSRCHIRAGLPTCEGKAFLHRQLYFRNNTGVSGVKNCIFRTVRIKITDSISQCFRSSDLLRYRNSAAGFYERMANC